jgi:hypothetical protein
MATFNPTWPAIGTSVRAAAAIANGANLTDALNLATLGPYYGIDAFILFDIGSGSPSGDLVIEVFHSVDGGSTVATVASVTRRLNFTAVAAKSLVIQAIRGAHVTLKYTNSTGVTGNVTVKYCASKQVST